MRYDVTIVGGSFAGLSAATYLARANRTVCIVDTGSPRNRFASHSHGFLTQDGAEPRAILAAARAQVAAYPTTVFKDTAVTSAFADAEGFSLDLATGETVSCSRLVLAFGITDELPQIPGLAERWGRSVLHCPYCHGFEFSGRRLGVLNTSELSLHQALLIREWGPTTLFLNGREAPGDETLSELLARGVTLVSEPLKALHGNGDVLTEVELVDGRTLSLDALYISPRNRLNSGIGQQLGCATEAGPLGSMIRTDAMKMTSVPGVYAAGDITRAAHSVTWASADGVTAGTAAHRSLVFW